MIKKLCGVLAATFLLGLSSCSDENPWLGEEGRGAIRLELTTDASVKDAAPQTRAGESNGLFTEPGLTDFNIHLKRADGSTHTHETYDNFVALIKDATFPTGSYTLTAYAGKPEEEGFDKPYFEGTTSLTVLENNTSTARVTASLANTMVSVEYTEGFKSYMKDYTATVHSDGNGYIDIPKDETRPAFIVPGLVSLSINFTNQQGQSLKLQPAEFTAKAGYRYHVTLDVNNGNNGVAQLTIKFDENLVKEEIEIDLTDELYSAPEPTVKVKAEGMGQGVEGVPYAELLAGASLDGENRFTIISYGMIRDVKLTLKGYTGDPDLAGDINLIEASPAVQDKLAHLGLDCKGVFRNPDKMAYVDFSKFPANAGAGEYEVSVVAHDMLGRESEAKSVRFNLVAPEVTIKDGLVFSGNYKGHLIINYNGTNPAKDLTFEAWDAGGNVVPATVLSCVEAGTRAVEGRDYRVQLQFPAFGQREFERVWVKMNGIVAGQKDIPVQLPVSFEADAFSRKVLFKVNDPDGNTAEITNNVKITVDGVEVDASSVDRNPATGIITVSGLQPGKTYTYTFSGYDSEGTTTETEFTTEQETDVENGKFTDLETTINLTDIPSGGKYSYAFLIPNTQQNKSSIVIDTPKGWNTLNSLTCNPASNPQNTWFMVPSTMASAGTVTVRTVGYNPNGTELETYKTSATTYYSKITPTDLLVSPGELSYTSKNASASSFASRPAYLTFDYEYTARGEDTGLVEIGVYNAGREIARGSANLTGSGNGFRVNLSSYEFGVKADEVRIRFVSSTASSPEIYMPKDEELKDVPTGLGGGGASYPHTIAANEYKSLAVGSILKISNVKLNY